MNRVRSFLLMLSLALPMAGLLAACETVVDVAAPAHTPQLVVHSFFTPDSVWVVRVTDTAPFAAPEAPGFVEDATVEVWQGAQLVARPTRSDSGTYVASGRGAVPEARYTLRVAAPGYPPTEGHDVLPAPVPVATFGETLVQAQDASTRRRIVHVEITLDDPPGVRNYYGLFVFQGRWREDRRTGQVDPLPPSLFPFASDNLAFGESAFDFLETGKTLYPEAFFPDDLFDGDAYTLDFEIAYDRPRPDAEVAIGRVFSVVLLAVSEDFYRYWDSAGRQAFSNENPFAEPLRVHSNMTRGFGVFAGFQYRVFPLRLASPEAGPALAPLCTLLGGYLPVCGVRALSP